MKTEWVVTIIMKTEKFSKTMTIRKFNKLEKNWENSTMISSLIMEVMKLSSEIWPN
jgi:hypothetical protein